VLAQQPGEWQRLRLIGASALNWLNLDFGDCDAALLAKEAYTLLTSLGPSVALFWRQVHAPT